MNNLLWRGIARVVSQPKVADWLIRRAMKRPFTHLPSNDDPSYMARYWLFNPYPVSSQDRKRWQFPISIRLHHIKRADADRHMHDHPWNARTIILKGWYGEKRMVDDESVQRGHISAKIATEAAGARWLLGDYATEHFTRAPGDTATLRVGQYHTITDVPVDGVWTMFISGPWRADWGFLVEGVKVWWRDYLAQKEKGEAVKQKITELGPLAKFCVPNETRFHSGGPVSGSGPVPAIIDTERRMPAELIPLVNIEGGQDFVMPIMPQSPCTDLDRNEADTLSRIICCPHCDNGCAVCDPEMLFNWGKP